jgi:hypothetical protein
VDISLFESVNDLELYMIDTKKIDKLELLRPLLKKFALVSSKVENLAYVIQR